MHATTLCPSCRRAKAPLRGRGVSFTEKTVHLLLWWFLPSENLRERTRRDASAQSAPQISIGNACVGGCDDLHALETFCGLDLLLSGAGRKLHAGGGGRGEETIRQPMGRRERAAPGAEDGTA
jgi:glutaredoxin 3